MPDDHSTDQGDNDGDGEKWMASECMLKIEFTGSARDWM